DIFLSLSGHTHAGQIGLTRGKIHISPASLIYPEWDGLYRHGNQYLYVNRGIGYVGVPMRIGVPPEITLIVLKRRKN
ncbi:MAG TPA: metallophosphoesterase, partial [Paludibacteraceae bacterium]|nr:metallophosphoesterase [Paludibacteraceae bacterium]